MFNQEKQDKRELLLEVAELIEVLARCGTKFNNAQAFDLAEQFGKIYFELKEKP